MLFSVIFSQEEWISWEFFFTHSKRKRIRIEYKRLMKPIMTERDNSGSSISDILHETPTRFYPEFYVIFFEELSYGESVFFIREKS
jgi:hypothetical protein